MVIAGGDLCRARGLGCVTRDSAAGATGDRHHDRAAATVCERGDLAQLDLAIRVGAGPGYRWTGLRIRRPTCHVQRHRRIVAAVVVGDGRRRGADARRHSTRHCCSGRRNSRRCAVCLARQAGAVRAFIGHVCGAVRRCDGTAAGVHQDGAARVAGMAWLSARRASRWCGVHGAAPRAPATARTCGAHAAHGRGDVGAEYHRLCDVAQCVVELRIAGDGRRGGQHQCRDPRHAPAGAHATACDGSRDGGEFDLHWQCE